MILFGVETLHLIRLRNQLQKRLSGPVVVAKNTEHHRGDVTRVLFLHAAHYHAKVLGFDDDTHPGGDKQ